MHVSYKDVSEDYCQTGRIDDIAVVHKIARLMLRRHRRASLSSFLKPLNYPYDPSFAFEIGTISGSDRSPIIEDVESTSGLTELS